VISMLTERSVISTNGSNGIVADQQLSASYLMLQCHADFPDFFEKLNKWLWLMA